MGIKCVEIAPDQVNIPTALEGTNWNYTEDQFW
jgi:hypothetical protein